MNPGFYINHYMKSNIIRKKRYSELEFERIRIRKELHFEYLKDLFAIPTMN